MDIELAKFGDYADIAALLAESGLTCAVAPDHIEDCLVLRFGRNLVGVAQLRCQGNWALGLCLTVRPGFRRMGLGKRLGQAMLEHCRGKGVERLFVYSDRAPFYFRSLGFQTAMDERVPGAVYNALMEIRDGAPLQNAHLLEYRTVVPVLTE